jgi:hypothetical protein
MLAYGKTQSRMQREHSDIRPTIHNLRSRSWRFVKSSKKFPKNELICIVARPQGDFQDFPKYRCTTFIPKILCCHYIPKQILKKNSNSLIQADKETLPLIDKRNSGITFAKYPRVAEGIDEFIHGFEVYCKASAGGGFNCTRFCDARPSHSFHSPRRSQADSIAL